MDAFTVGLSWFSLLLLIGIISTIVANKIRIPEILLLIIIGLIAGNTLNIRGILPYNIITGVSLFALIMIVFESSSKFKIGEIKSLSPHALKLAIVFVISTLFLLTIFTQLLFAEEILEVKTLLISLIFSSLMVGTDPSIALSALKESKNRLIEILKIESIINTPLTVLIPVLLLNFYLGKGEVASFAVTFLQQIMTGIGAGLILGYIIFRLFNKIKIEGGSSLLIIGLVLGTYTLTEQIGGSGILAITTFGILYGYSKFREKITIQKFNTLFTEFLTILVFILIGMVIKIPLTGSFLIKSLILFAIYLLVRHFAVNITFRKSNLTNKEKIFMSLNVPKGIATAIVIFTIASYKNPSLEGIQSLAFIFLLYSIILSSVVSRFGSYFLRLGESGKTTIKKLKKRPISS